MNIFNRVYMNILKVTLIRGSKLVSVGIYNCKNL